MRQQRRGESALGLIGGIVVLLVIGVGLAWFFDKDRGNTAPNPQTKENRLGPGKVADVPIGNILEDQCGFRKDHYAVAVRNSGAAGTVSVSVCFTDDPPLKDKAYLYYPKAQFFAAGEERTLMFEIPAWAKGKPIIAKARVD